jgi:hypothetical protein
MQSDGSIGQNAGAQSLGSRLAWRRADLACSSPGVAGPEKQGTEHNCSEDSALASGTGKKTKNRTDVEVTGRRSTTPSGSMNPPGADDRARPVIAHTAFPPGASGAVASHRVAAAVQPPE